jgi:hypothetical protein
MNFGGNRNGGGGMTLEDDVESILSEHFNASNESMFRIRPGGLATGQNIGGGDSTYRGMDDSVFGFEDETEALAAWKTWISNGEATVMDFSIESSPAGGALDTNGYAKININTPNVEVQLFTKNNEDPYNAVLKSNTKYEFSFYVKSDDYTQFTAAETSNESATQAWKNFAWYSPVIEVDSEWSFKTVTFSTGDLTPLYPEGTANNVWTQFKFVQTTVGTLYIDELSLKEVQ